MRALVLLILSVLFLSCDEGTQRQFEPKSTALGVMNEIVVIADQNTWEGAVGDTFRYYFSSAFPILPTPEPIFDLRHFTLSELQGEPMRKELRTYVVLANLSDENSETAALVRKDIGEERFNKAMDSGTLVSTVGKDKWARGQLLIYLFGKDSGTLIDAIRQNYPAIASRINEHDARQLNASIYIDRINEGLSSEVAEWLGIRIDIPGEYKVAVRDKENNLVWLRKDTPEAIMNIVLHRLEYSDTTQFMVEHIMSLRNEFGRSYVSSDEDNDVMVINTEDLPVYDYVSEIDGQYTRELRGTWEMTESFAAGPFISYLIKSEDGKSIIFADVFVLAPGEEKRDMMMQLNHIIKSAEIVN